MKHYLFYDEKQDKNILNEKINWVFVFFAVFMMLVAFVVMTEEILAFFPFFLCSILSFPGFPLMVRSIYKSFYIELMDDYVFYHGAASNVYEKKKIMYEDIFYIERERIAPVICPRGETTKRMVKKYGKYTNVYDRDRKYLFSFRDNPLIIEKLLKKNPDIEVVKCLDRYFF